MLIFFGFAYHFLPFYRRETRRCICIRISNRSRKSLVREEETACCCCCRCCCRRNEMGKGRTGGGQEVRDGSDAAVDHVRFALQGSQPLPGCSTSRMLRFEVCSWWIVEFFCFFCLFEERLPTPPVSGAGGGPEPPIEKSTERGISADKWRSMITKTRQPTRRDVGGLSDAASHFLSKRTL